MGLVYIKISLKNLSIRAYIFNGQNTNLFIIILT